MPFPMPVAAFIVVETAFLAAVHALGGPPWVALGVLAVTGQVMADFRVGPLVGLVPALGWAALHHATGDRELFFPYAMALAAHLAGQFAARGPTTAAAAGGLAVAAFLAIRLAQRATAGVLVVELAVAAAILAAAVVVLQRTSPRPWARATVATAASLAAYAGLAL